MCALGWRHDVSILRMLLLASAVCVVAHAQAPGQIPSESLGGDVVLGLNSFGGYSALLAPFMEAIWAWEERLIVNDTSPGAVVSRAPRTYTVGWDLKDDMNDPGVGLKNSVNNTLLRAQPVNAQVGMWQDVTLPAAQLAHQTQDVIVGYVAYAAQLSDKSKYAYFLRTSAASTAGVLALARLLQTLQVTSVVWLLLQEAAQLEYYTNLRDHTSSWLSIHAARFATNSSLWGPVFEEVLALHERYMICYVEPHRVDFWTPAITLGLLSPDRQWIAFAGLATRAGDHLRHFHGTIGIQPRTTGSLYPSWVQWLKTLSFSRFPAFFSAGSIFPLSPPILTYNEGSDFLDPVLADATFALLFAIERLHAAGTPVKDCRGAKLLAELKKTSFEGISGLVEFDENGDRRARYDIYNIVDPHAPGLQGVQVRGSWTAAEGVIIGGWEGNIMSTEWPPLVFTNGSTTPLPIVVTGCPKGERYLGYKEGCGPCSVGTFNPTDGNIKDTCLPCEAGLHGPVEGLSVCTVCPLGSFQNSTGQVECQACPVGWFADGVGRTGCEICQRGTFSDSGASGCTSCKLGTFSFLEGSAQCSKCPFGFTTEFVGSRVADSCVCPANSLFIPAAAVARSAASTISPSSLGSGSCFRCDDPADKDLYQDGLVCLGGRTCEAVPNTTIVSSFPCPMVDCVDVDDCRSQCILPVHRAREVCESFDFGDICEGWAVKSSAPLHSDLLYPDSRLGWQNVAILGRISSNAAHARTYGTPASGFSLIPRRSMCAPVPMSDPAAIDLLHAKHTVGSFLQPPLIKPGYYMLDLSATRRAGLPNSLDGRDSDGLAVKVSSAIVATSSVVVGVEQPWDTQWFQLLPLDQQLPSSESPGVVPLFKCASPSICSGGYVGQCFPGQVGLGCGACASGFYTSSTTGCTSCTGGSLGGVMVAFFGVLAVVVLILLYKMTLHPLASQLTARMTTGLALGLTFNGLQTFGVISLLSIDLGEPLAGILASLRVLLFDMDQLQWECIMEVSPVGKMGARLLVPPMIVVAYFVLFGLSRALPRGRVQPWTLAHTKNCAGMVLQVLFISICMAVIMPFKCTTHPVFGITTLVDIPHQVCGAGDQLPMSAVGGVFIFLYPVLGLAVCAYIIYILPERTAMDPTFLNSWKFLVSRFRFDRYYFGVVFLLRNLAIALVPLVNPSNPMLQQVVMSAVLLVAVVLQAILWPWAATEVNYLDMSCLLSMMMMVVLSAGMIDSKTVDLDMVRVASGIALAVALFTMLFVVLTSAIKFVADVCGKKGRCVKLSKLMAGTKRAKEVGEVAGSVTNVAGALVAWKPHHVLAMVGTLPDYDRATLSKAMAVLLSVLDAGVSQSTGTDKRSGTGPLRITVQRFKRRSSLAFTSAEQSAEASHPVSSAVDADSGGPHNDATGDWEV